MKEYTPTYRPRAGSKTERAVELIRENAGLSCQPLAEILECDARNVRNYLAAPIRRNVLTEEHRGGVLFFIACDGSTTEPDVQQSDGIDAGQDSVETIADEFGEAQPAADTENAAELVQVEETDDETQASGPTYGIYSDGRLVFMLDDTEALVFSADQTQKLRHDLNAVLG